MKFSLLAFLLLFTFAESALAWRCCQRSGKDAPGVFLTKNICEQKGHLADDGLLCPLESASLARARSNPEEAFRKYLDSRYNVLSPNISSAAKCIMNQKPIAEQKASSYASMNQNRIKQGDKFLHCSVSALLKKSCGHAPAEVAGHVREIYQLFDNRPNNSFGSGDERANAAGRSIASKASSEDAIFKACSDSY